METNTEIKTKTKNRRMFQGSVGRGGIGGERFVKFMEFLTSVTN